MRKRTQRDLVDRVKREMGIDDSLIADSVRGQKTVPELRTSFMYFNGPFRYRYFMYRKGRSLRKFCWSTTRNDGGGTSCRGFKRST